MSENKNSRGAHNQQVARAGEHFVVAELNKGGAFAVSFAGNMPKIDLIACARNQSRTIHIQVKTKSGGRPWHASIVSSKPTRAPENPLSETLYWVFVDLGQKDGTPRYWIAPDWWVRNDIYEAHRQYLESHGGRRAKNPDSAHHAIDEERLKQWQGRWEILGILD